MRKAVLVVCVVGWLLCPGLVNAESSEGEHEIWINISGNGVDATWTYNEQEDKTTGPGTTPVYLSRTAVYIVTAGCSCDETNHDVTITGKDKVDPADETRCGFTTTGSLTLTATCDATSISVSTSDVYVLGLDILQVPEYIYADGIGAVPVQFQILGYPQAGVTMSNSGSDEVEFLYQSDQQGGGGLEEGFTYAVANGFAKGDGFGDQGNSDTDTYWLWVRNNACTFQWCDVDGDTTDEGMAEFRVTMHVDTDGQPSEIKLESIVEDEPEPWFDYDADDPDGFIDENFGDEEVEVVVLNDEEAEDISLFKAATKQTKLNTDPSFRVMHVGTGCGSVVPGCTAPCWTGTRHNTSSCGGAWDDYTRHGTVHGFKDGDWEANHIGASASGKKMQTRAWMSNGWGNRSWGERFHMGNYSNTVGVYFGFSYGTRAVGCLGGDPGMDLSQDGTGGSLNKCAVQMFNNDAKRKWSVWDVDPGGTSFGSLGAGAFTLMGALTTGGWSAVFWMSAWALSTFTPSEVDNDNRGEAAWHPVRIHKLSGGTGTPVYLSGTGPIRETDQTAGNEQDWANARSESFTMNADPVSAAVGHVQTFSVAVGAGVCYETWSGLIGGDEAGAWAGLEWGADDNDVRVIPYE